MADSIPGSYKQVFFIKNNSADNQKILKSVFLLGPSKAVLSNGKVLVSSSKIAQDQDSDGQPQQDQSSQSSQQNNSDNGGSQSNSNEIPNESYNYSVFEALSHLRKVYEDDNEDDSNPGSDSDQNSDDQEEKEDTTEVEFNASTDLDVVVNLPNEGCTKWHLRLNHVSEPDKVINAIKSKKFKAAFDIANAQAAKAVSEGQSAEGITVLSATTMLDKKKEELAPFIGKCRWAFDVGSEDDNSDSFELELAIAPIDGKTKKPITKTVYHSVFNIVGDITNGRLDGFDKFIKAKDFVTGNSDRDDDKDSDSSELLHKWIENTFKNVGDSSMYAEFLHIRKFVEDNIKKKTLEFNKSESNNVTNYVNTVKSSFISF